MLPGEKRATGIVAMVAMLRMFGLFALLPVLSLYAAELENATPLLVGLAVGAYGLTQAGLQIPLGALSDRIGRLPVIIAGLAFFMAVAVALSGVVLCVTAVRNAMGRPVVKLVIQPPCGMQAKLSAMKFPIM